MKRTIFLLLSFFSCFIIVSMSFIPSAQSSLVQEEFEFIKQDELNHIMNFYSNTFLGNIINFLLLHILVFIVGFIYGFIKNLPMTDPYVQTFWDVILMAIIWGGWFVVFPYLLIEFFIVNLIKTPIDFIIWLIDFLIRYIQRIIDNLFPFEIGITTRLDDYIR